MKNFFLSFTAIAGAQIIILPFVFFLFLLIPHLAFNQNATDSLQKALNNSIEDSARVNILYALWRENIYTDISIAREYAMQQYILSKKMNYQAGLSSSLICLGYCSVNEGNYAKGLLFSQKALRISENTGDFNAKFLSLEQIASIHYYREDYNEAISFYKKLLETAVSAGHPEYLAGTYCSMGAAYLNLQLYDSSLLCYRHSLSAYKDLDQKNNLALVNANIGDVYKEMDSLNAALKYYSEALGLCLGMENPDDKDNLAYIYYSMGEIAGRMRDHQRSLDYFIKALDFTEEISEKKRTQREIFTRMTAEYERVGDYKNALAFYKLFGQLKDSLLNEESLRNINELEAKYESKNKDDKIKFLTKENELEKLKSERKDLITWLITAVSFAFLVITVLLYAGYRQKRRSNRKLVQKVRERTAKLTEVNEQLQKNIGEMVEKEQQLHQANSELNTLLYRISHDLRTPLISVMGLVNLFRVSNSTEDKDKCIKMIDQSVTNMDNILRVFISINLMREAKLNIEPVCITSLTEDILKMYKMDPELQNLVIRMDLEIGLMMNTDRGILHSLIQNLVDNAIKFRKFGINDPAVSVKASSHLRGITLIVEDNGIGMKPETEQKAFDLFYKGTEEIQGSGLGLYLVKKAVESLRGSIGIKTKWTEGTRFEVFLPQLNTILPEMPNSKESFTWN